MNAEQTHWQDKLGDAVQPGQVLADKYRIERIVGIGGMGVVVEAFHLHFEERVAIKFLMPQMGATEEALGRFEREARAAFKIKTEHAAKVMDVGRLAGGPPYMVMEFLEGRDLGTLLEQQGSLGVQDAVEYVLQACEAVGEAHTRGIVHRDLKPENLFLTHRPDGTPCIKVLDFGLSKLTTRDPHSRRERSLTSGEAVMGSPTYMSPEQWMCSRDVGPAADIWSLGAILFELLAGRPPFFAPQVPQLCAQVLHSEPEALSALRPGLPPGLDPVIRRCLRKAPEDRYPSVAELVVALVGFGPSRARTSAKRTTGMMRRAGLAAEGTAVPPSEYPPPREAPASGAGAAGSAASEAAVAAAAGLDLAVASGDGPRPGAAGWPQAVPHQPAPGRSPIGAALVAGLLVLGIVGVVAAIVALRSPNDAATTAPVSTATAGTAVGRGGASSHEGRPASVEPTGGSAVPAGRPGAASGDGGTAAAARPPASSASDAEGAGAGPSAVSSRSSVGAKGTTRPRARTTGTGSSDIFDEM